MGQSLHNGMTVTADPDSLTVTIRLSRAEVARRQEASDLENSVLGSGFARCDKPLLMGNYLFHGFILGANLPMEGYLAGVGNMAVP